MAHYKGSLVIVKPFRGDVAPTVTLLDKEELTAVRCAPIVHRKHFK